MLRIDFTPRWKEELVATCAEGVLIFEFTMGVNHVYFPNEEKWRQSVPEWAKDKWNQFYDECTNWCSRNNVPISVVDSTFVYAEKKKL
jgi:hypothetical protein